MDQETLGRDLELHRRLAALVAHLRGPHRMAILAREVTWERYHELCEVHRSAHEHAHPEGGDWPGTDAIG